MKKLALIVDDNYVIRKNIREILEEFDFEVYEGCDGIEGIKLFKELKPSLVTMDINMPNLNGLDATVEILKLNKRANILICSSMLFLPYYQKLATNAGAKALLSKPFTKLEFIKAVNELLENQ